jgi:shikimate kinase
MKILITGFMGSGKTHWLNELKKNASSNKYQFLDLDEEIARSLKLKSGELGDWITGHGLEAFRELESNKLNLLLSNDSNLIISLGGGALTLKLLDHQKQRRDFKIIFLNTPFEICFERIKNDSNRPLSKLTKGELKNLYDERISLYREAALILSESDRKEIDGVDPLVHTLFSTN